LSAIEFTLDAGRAGGLGWVNDPQVAPVSDSSSGVATPGDSRERFYLRESVSQRTFSQASR